MTVGPVPVVVTPAAARPAIAQVVQAVPIARDVGNYLTGTVLRVTGEMIARPVRAAIARRVAVKTTAVVAKAAWSVP